MGRVQAEVKQRNWKCTFADAAPRPPDALGR